MTESTDNENHPTKSVTTVLAPLYGFLLAVSFLTNIPVPIKNTDDDFTWKWSTAFYPVCGALIGIVAVCPLLLTLVYTPPLENLPLMIISLFFYLVILEWMPRMLHFDGFCDCCDAFSAMSATPEERLKIMKDPHVGSTAVGASILLFLGKAMALFLLMNLSTLWKDHRLGLILSLIAIPVTARFGMLCLAAIGNYPRETGTGKRIIGKVPLFSLIFGAITVIPVLIYLPPISVILCFFAVAFVVFYWKIKAGHKIGGVTGDVLGACCETAELAVAFSFLVAIFKL